MSVIIAKKKKNPATCILIKIWLSASDSIEVHQCASACPSSTACYGVISTAGISWNAKNIVLILTVLNNYIKLIKRLHFLTSVDGITIFKAKHINRTKQ